MCVRVCVYVLVYVRCKLLGIRKLDLYTIYHCVLFHSLSHGNVIPRTKSFLLHIVFNMMNVVIICYEVRWNVIVLNM